MTVSAPTSELWVGVFTYSLWENFRLFYGAWRNIIWLLRQSCFHGTLISPAMDWAVSGLESRQGQDIFLFSTASRSALGLTQPLFRWVPGLFPASKTAGAWSWSPPPSSEVKNEWSCSPTPPVCICVWRGTTWPFLPRYPHRRTKRRARLCYWRCQYVVPC
jgi:hypothetical protein